MGASLQVIAKLHQKSGAFADRSDGAPGVFRQVMGDSLRLFQAMKPRISRFFLVAVLAVACIQNVVDDLKRQSDSIAVLFDPLDVAFEYGNRFVELLVAGWLSAAEIVVVHRGKIIVDQ